MEEQAVIPNTFVIERSYPVPRERVFAALSQSEKKRRWYAERDGHDVTGFTMDFRIGGESMLSYRLGPDTPFEGVEIVNEEQFHDIVPDRRIVSASTMSLGGRRFSVSLVTIELIATETGTDLVCIHQGVFFEGADGPEMREAGWRALFDKLASALAGAEAYQPQ